MDREEIKIIEWQKGKVVQDNKMTEQQSDEVLRLYPITLLFFILFTVYISRLQRVNPPFSPSIPGYSFPYHWDE